MVIFKEALLTPTHLVIHMEYAAEEEQSDDINESFAPTNATKAS